jgi:hypothetical protein
MLYQTPKQEWQLILEKAADLLEERGHCKNTQVAKDGSLCAHGAINMAYSIRTNTPYRFDSNHIEEVGKASLAVARYLNNIGVMSSIAHPKWGGLAYWNNAWSRTATEVIDAMRTAASMPELICEEEMV